MAVAGVFEATGGLLETDLVSELLVAGRSDRIPSCMYTDRCRVGLSAAKCARGVVDTSG